ncbi:MAG TPA: thermonuclease family protein [Pyrinomonadaceae bacterium]|nr:thermonuclease family protein [Pyrinomonadaceae bacterium]
MQIQFRWSSLIVLAICLLACRANAASLTGKVIEVNDGDEITIFNLNRPVRIRLIGMDAPEKNQAFGDVAKQHLADLVYGKVVFVEYSGIAQHSSLVGRVLLNETDISAQMLRDGAAWFDNRFTLSEPQREMYSQSERAARNERRGLWQTDGAVAPWEFVKAEALKTTSVVGPTKGGPTQLVRPDDPAPELNSMSLLKTGGGVAKPLSVLSEEYAAFDDSRKPWYQFKPEGEDFSAFVPKGGAQKLKPLTLLDRTVEINYYVVRDRDSVYELLWAIGPNQDKTDAQAIKAGLSGIYKEMNRAFQKSGVGTFECDPLSERNISSGNYVGTEFDLTSCPLRGMARVYTRVIGDQRQLYLGFVFFNEMDDKVSQFVNSFRVSDRKSSDNRPKRTN